MSCQPEQELPEARPKEQALALPFEEDPVRGPSISQTLPAKQVKSFRMRCSHHRSSIMNEAMLRLLKKGFSTNFAGIIVPVL